MTSADRVGLPILDEMAGFLASHKLILFFGAGISRSHLGFSAPELASEMATHLGIPVTTHLADASDRFITDLGEGAFVDFLRSRLVRSSFDDAKGVSHLLLLGLACGVLYTTNQDNLFELCAEKYGRPYSRVVTLGDLSDAQPGEPLLIKFHGDLDEPASLVFTTTSYERRIADRDNPLDIRLRSDLLGKRLLFVGYSFQDENVKKLFEEIRNVFADHLPTSEPFTVPDPRRCGILTRLGCFG